MTADSTNQRTLIINMTADNEASRFVVDWQSKDEESLSLEPRDIRRYPTPDTQYTVLYDDIPKIVGGMPAVYMEVSYYSADFPDVIYYGMIVRVVSGYDQYDFRFNTRCCDVFETYWPVVMEMIASVRFYN